MTDKSQLITIIIPFLNEEENLPIIYSRCENVSNKIHIQFEYLFIDDGSSDKSIEIVKNLTLKNNNVKYIQFSRNFGHQKAITAGLKYCSGDAAIIIDADLQDPPEEIENLINKWKQGFDVVHAVRSKRKGEPRIKKVFAHIFYRIMSRITEIHMTVDSGDFRLINRKAIDALNSMPEQHRYMRGLAAWIGFNQGYIDYVRDPRLSGKTKYPFIKSLSLALNAITSFSGTPLRIIFYLGNFLCLISLAVAIYVFVAWNFIEQKIPAHAGTTYLTLAIFFVSGLQMLCMGILSQYIRRVFDEIKNRPLFIIKDTNIK